MIAMSNGAAPPGLTRTEANFYGLLADGRPHTPDELTKHLWDSLGVNLQASVRFHIHNIRRKLPAGEYITTTPIGQKIHYILVRNPPPPAAPPAAG